MEKIKLTKRGKKILLLLKEGKYKPEKSDFNELNLLTIEGLGQVTRGLCDSFITYQLTDKGKAYLLSNRFTASSGSGKIPFVKGLAL